MWRTPLILAVVILTTVPIGVDAQSFIESSTAFALALGAGGAEPEPAEALDAPGWPDDGSYATYLVHSTRNLSRGAVRETFANATWTYISGVWILRCVGEYNLSAIRSGSGTQWSSGTFSRVGPDRLRDAQPPLVVERSSTWWNNARSVTAWRLEACVPASMRVSIAPDAVDPLNLTGHSSGLFSRGGSATWDPATKLLLSWQTTRGSTMSRGELVATDAPLAAP